MKTYNINNASQNPLIPINQVMNTTINSNPIPLQDTYIFSIQIVFTGTPTGSFKLQESCDPVSLATATGLQTGLPTRWTDIANSSFTVSAAGNVGWNFQFPGYNWVRIVYTDSSSGSSTAVITSTTFNGKAS